MRTPILVIRKVMFREAQGPFRSYKQERCDSGRVGPASIRAPTRLWDQALQVVKRGPPVLTHLQLLHLTASTQHLTRPPPSSHSHKGTLPLSLSHGRGWGELWGEILAGKLPAKCKASLPLQPRANASVPAQQQDGPQGSWERQEGQGSLGKTRAQSPPLLA